MNEQDIKNNIKSDRELWLENHFKKVHGDKYSEFINQKYR